ncbi:MAG: hypothetical protein R3282_08305 [Rhodothermales bacterium]|nr:hypothetical protein [Rhodothermales bacterium]
MEEASHPQESAAKRWQPQAPDRPSQGRTGSDAPNEESHPDFLDLQSSDVDGLDELDELDELLSDPAASALLAGGELGADDDEEGGSDLWDLIMQDPSLFIRDEIESLTDELTDAAVRQAEQRAAESVDADPAVDAEVVAEVTEARTHADETEALATASGIDDAQASSSDARGDSPGMPDHPASASDEEPVEVDPAFVDEEALPGAFPRDRVVSMLLRKKVVSAEQVDQAKELSKQHPREVLWRVLALVPSVNRDAIYAEAASVYAFPTAEIGDGRPNPEFVRLVMNTSTRRSATSFSS